MNGEGSFLIEEFLFGEKDVSNDVDDFWRLNSDPLLFCVQDNLNAKNGQSHVGNGFNWHYFLDLTAVNKV